jgi:hypothetical protein
MLIFLIAYDEDRVSFSDAGSSEPEYCTHLFLLALDSATSENPMRSMINPIFFILELIQEVKRPDV